MKNGKGIYHEKNGRRLEGEFLNSQPHGKAIMYESDGKSEERVYQNGNIITRK